MRVQKDCSENGRVCLEIASFPTSVAASVLNTANRPTPARNRRSKIRRRPTNADIQSTAICNRAIAADS
jgi:hypothetical protein